MAIFRTLVALFLSGCGLQDPTLFRAGGGGAPVGFVQVGTSGVSINPATGWGSAFADANAASPTTLVTVGDADGSLGGAVLGTPAGGAPFVIAWSSLGIPYPIAQFGGTNSTGASALLDSSGNCYVCGTGTGNPTGSTEIGMAGGVAVGFIAKVTPQQSIAWISRLSVGNVAASVQALFCALDPFGNPYIFGWTNNANTNLGFTQMGLAGNQEGFLAKLDPATGSKTWGVQFGTNMLNGALVYSRALTFDSSGNPYLAGHVGAHVTGTQYGGGGRLGFAAKFNPSTGANLWWSEIGSGNSVTFHQPVIDGASLYVGGTFAGATLGGTQYGTYSTGVNGLMAAFDLATGTNSWRVGIGGGGAGSSQLLPARIASGKVYGVGSCTGTCGNVIGAAGTNNLLAARYDAATGGMDWATQAGGTTWRDVENFVFNGTDLLLVSDTTQTLGTQVGTHGTKDLVAISLNASTGASQSVVQYGGGAGSSFDFYTTSNDGTNAVYVAGTSTGTMGSFLIGSHGTTDLALAKFQLSSATAEWLYQIGSPGADLLVGGISYSSATSAVRVLGSISGASLGTQQGSQGIIDLFFLQVRSSGTLY